MDEQYAAINEISVTRGFWARLLTGAGPGGVRFGNGRWLFEQRAAKCELPAADVVSVWVRRGLVWSTLQVATNDDRRECPGLPHDSADRIRGRSEAVRLLPQVEAALADWQHLESADVYLNHCRWSEWRDKHAPLRAALRLPAATLPSPPAGAIVQRFMRLHDTIEAAAEAHNTAFMARELRECAGLFDRLERIPLTRAQRLAAVTNEDNTLVVAGAGTGKTSVVVARVGYLIRRLGVHPDQILVLAFNASAAEEVRQRIKARAQADVAVRTFHALGLSILRRHLGKRPSLSSLQDDDAALAFVTDILRRMLSEPMWSRLLTRFFVEYLAPCRGPEEFQSLHAHNAYVRGAGVVSLRGEPVRTHDECTIANWLFVNGVAYEYRRPYEHHVTDEADRPYRPGFFLVESGTYLEHFGIDRKGRTAPYIDRDTYRRRMAWVRSVHRRFGTRLVETYSSDRMDGALLERLAERLAAVKVRPKPLPLDELMPVLEERRAPSQLAQLVTTYLRHFKERRLDVGERKASSSEPRAQCFLWLFEEVYRQYQQRLADERAIDFQDMISRAADVVEGGHARLSFTHVLVDEFQDLSRGRARLLTSLLAQSPDRRLTCVGDDWQSIYRFAGSDLTLMTAFPQHFGHTATVTLDETFRFGQGLVDVGSRFICENPSQLRKQIRSHRELKQPPVVIIAHHRPMERDPQAHRAAMADDIRRVLRQIDRELGDAETVRVCLLGRYNHSLPVPDAQSLADGLPRLMVDFRTVHRAKGLEADFVVVLELVRGRYGFPSEIVDDPLLSLVLASPDGYPHAEERRLFYVALTRARRRVYLLTSSSRRSAFVDELLGPAYAGLVEANRDMGSRVPCHACGGVLVDRVKATSGARFWGCADYPYCDGSAPVCRVCLRGALVLDGVLLRCSEPSCRRHADVCPRCERGRLVERSYARSRRERGRSFVACSRWKADGTGCDFRCDPSDVQKWRTRRRRRR